MNTITHFEIKVENPQQAIDFYSKTFGWKFEKWDNPDIDYWLIMTRDKENKYGIDGGLSKRDNAVPASSLGVNSFLCFVQVENFDEINAKIAANGGKVTTPKMAIPTVGWVGYFDDLDGNAFGIFQEDKNAK